MEFFRFINFIFVFQEINSFLIISMIVKKVDNCIRKIELEDGTNLYERTNITCEYFNGYNLDYNIPIFEPIPYEILNRLELVYFIIITALDVLGGNCFITFNASSLASESQ